MRLSKLIKKKSLTVLGLSSGTSADGIDVAIVKISGPDNMEISQEHFSVVPFPPEVRQALLESAAAQKNLVEYLARLNFLLGELLAEAALEVMEKSKIKVDLIGSHGQTIRHLPEAQDFLGRKVKATWQIGEGDVIAKKAGTVTICDFRAGDIAVGGAGAPLTPYVNYLLFGNQKATAVLNIGGIANLSAWPKKGDWKDIIGFDCGPGNMVIDGLMKILFEQAYDQEGLTAKSGKVNRELLNEFLAHPFFGKHPPKSTGREEFGERYARMVKEQGEIHEASSQDLIATASEMTVQAIRDSYRRFIRPEFEIEELYLTGGGSYNRYLEGRLEELFKGIKIMTLEKRGFDRKGLEAVSFAVLAYLAIHNLPANLPQVTGAKKRAVLGKICLP
jgi:anhydro-N-acetylmuramic acid kinase